MAQETGLGAIEVIFNFLIKLLEVYQQALMKHNSDIVNNGRLAGIEKQLIDKLNNIAKENSHDVPTMRKEFKEASDEHQKIKSSILSKKIEVKSYTLDELKYIKKETKRLGIEFEMRYSKKDKVSVGIYNKEDRKKIKSILKEYNKEKTKEYYKMENKEGAECFKRIFSEKYPKVSTAIIKKGNDYLLQVDPNKNSIIKSIAQELNKFKNKFTFKLENTPKGKKIVIDDKDGNQYTTNFPPTLKDLASIAKKCGVAVKSFTTFFKTKFGPTKEQFVAVKNYLPKDELEQKREQKRDQNKVPKGRTR